MMSPYRILTTLVGWQLLYNSGDPAEEGSYPESWQVGDVIGIAIDLSEVKQNKGKFLVFVNGGLWKPNGEVISDLTDQDVAGGVFPAFTLEGEPCRARVLRLRQRRTK